MKKIAEYYKKLPILAQQLITALTAIGLLMGILFISGIVSFGKNAKVDNTEPKEVKATKTEIETAANMVDEQQVWRYTVNNKVGEQDKQIKEFNEGLLDIRNDLNKIIKKDSEAVQTNSNEVMQQQIDVLTDMVAKLTKMQMSKDKGQAKSYEVMKVTLESKGDKEKLKHIEDTIPPGAFAKAVLLSGVDASTALSATSDPKPILVRIVDMGTLPRRFKSDLKDCHIVASGHGDISSERVYARLENLSCIERETGEVIETEVAGYIAGEDGRAGVKGEVIEKGRGYLAKSMIGGVLQGVAGVLNPGRNVVPGSLGGVNTLLTERQGIGDKFKDGLTQGAGSSMDRLSKYYIDRAESISPVVLVASGRTVDIVFTEGATIGTIKVRKEIEKKRIALEKESEND